jgi:alpha-glucosidase
MPWSGSEPPYGFSPEAAERSWLDQPEGWQQLTVDAQSSEAASMLSLYRAGLRLRRDAPWGDADELQWLPSTPTVLAFERGPFTCVVNFGPEAVSLLPGHHVLIASHELEGGAVPQDTTVWLRQADDSIQVNGKE